MAGEMEKDKASLGDDMRRVEAHNLALEEKIQDGQAALNRTVLEKDTRIEALKLEKGQLEGELSQAERRLAEQAQQYQQTIEELTRPGPWMPLRCRWSMNVLSSSTRRRTLRLLS
ncbi:hypothetical protein AAFF_G00017810 [Aldrovandia affinis]|uniref:Uncharacterized protein n=1 Tax=Aldrovandia affinis TaxID=143900 RepID=A0AAD7S5R7_9TELE|nr:hypothetical protein AAFF_G00017810 [Aldrovandia affinis]